MSKESKISGDLHLSFDVGHSSIGWAVLRSQSPEQVKAAGQPKVEILGTGVVTFGADDCLAIKRRQYRQQRRHARSTRQRIARMEQLLAHLGVLSAAELKARHDQGKGDSFAWQKAADVLAAARAVEPLPEIGWPELWDILRWYAHNRGYFSPPWANRSDAVLDDEGETDTEKVERAKQLMRGEAPDIKLHTETMAETIAAYTVRYEAAMQAWHRARASAMAEGREFKEPKPMVHFKGRNCAFPRETVVWPEVQALLSALKGKLPQLDDALIRALLGHDVDPLKDREAWKTLPCPDLKLPKRYHGGLLFGQMIPRFENRIIGVCPITFAEEYEQLIHGGQSQEDAKALAKVRSKVPNKSCLEFLNFRWAMTLANVRIGLGSEVYQNRDGQPTKLRPLLPTERRKVDAAVRKLGFLKVEKNREGQDGLIREGKNELRDIVIETTGCNRHNIEELMTDPNAKEGMELMPISGNTSAFRVGWGCFDDPLEDAEGNYRDSALRTRFANQLLRGRRLTLTGIIRQLEGIGQLTLARAISDAARKEASDKRGKLNDEKLTKLMTAEFLYAPISGRARYSRAKLRQAFQEVFRKDKSLHPREKNGCLDESAEHVQEALRLSSLDEQTNNHLVRHRLGVLCRKSGVRQERKPGDPKPSLLDDLIEEFAGGDKRRIGRIVVEVARDLQEMSGKTNKEKAKEAAAKLRNHEEVSKELADKLRDANGEPLRDSKGRPLASIPGLIRKARILHDLKNECPYTGRIFEFAHLVQEPSQFGKLDKDHIIPRSLRLSDALAARQKSPCGLERMEEGRSR